MYVKNLSVLLMVCCAVNLQAYKFTFKNHLTTPVAISLHLVAKSDYDTKTIPALGEYAFDFKLGNLYAGFCLDTNTVKIDGKEQPVLYTSQKVRDQIVREMKESGKTTTYALGTPKRTISSICWSKDFDIVVDRDGKACVIMVHGSY